MRKQELEQEITQIWFIYILAKECFELSFYLHKPETSDEQEYLNHSHDFNFIRHVVWRMSIIELSKLFSKSSNRDRYNLVNFINKIKEDGYLGNTGISNAKIEGWAKRLVSSDQVIKKVLDLRDKIYAHTDSNKKEYTSLEISFEEVKNLLALVEEIIKEIHYDSFDAEADMHSLFFDKNNFNIIKILAKEKRERLEKRFER